MRTERVYSVYMPECFYESVNGFKATVKVCARMVDHENRETEIHWCGVDAVQAVNGFMRKPAVFNVPVVAIAPIFVSAERIQERN